MLFFCCASSSFFSQLLKDVSGMVTPGQLVCLMGASGAGKRSVPLFAFQAALARILVLERSVHQSCARCLTASSSLAVPTAF